MSNETLRNIKSRRSCRIFEPEQLRDNELEAIVESGLYAPSAINEQPWHFTVIQNEAVMKRMTADVKDYLLSSGNPHFQQMAQELDFNIFHSAPTAILISGDTKAAMPQADCAAAAQTMLIAAESLGIGSCWVDTPVYLFTGDKGSLWEKELGIPEGYKPIHGIVLGYKPSAAIPKAPKRKENAINYIK